VIRKGNQHLGGVNCAARVLKPGLVWDQGVAAYVVHWFISSRNLQILTCTVILYLWVKLLRYTHPSNWALYGRDDLNHHCVSNITCEKFALRSLEHWYR
jgi:hypothetical protein